MLSPLSIARGVQNKVLEAMAMARPVLLTKEAATGIDAVDGEHWMLCEDEPEAMSNRIDALRADPKAAKAMGEAARQFVLDHHNWDAMLAPLEALVDVRGEEARNAA